MNEADTCRKLVRPKLEAANWDVAGRHFYSEQIQFTDGRIVAPGGKPKRLKRRIADHPHLTSGHSAICSTSSASKFSHSTRA